VVRNSTESISDALWMSVLAGLGGMCVELILVGGCYLFEPALKRSIDEHRFYVLMSFPIIFIVGFGICVASVLEFQFFRGKWK
jgi:hypothetical protein